MDFVEDGEAGFVGGDAGSSAKGVTGWLGEGDGDGDAGDGVAETIGDKNCGWAGDWLGDATGGGLGGDGEIAGRGEADVKLRGDGGG